MAISDRLADARRGERSAYAAALAEREARGGSSRARARARGRGRARAHAVSARRRDGGGARGPISGLAGGQRQRSARSRRPDPRLAPSHRGRSQRAVAPAHGPAARAGERRGRPADSRPGSQSSRPSASAWSWPSCLTASAVARGREVVADQVDVVAGDLRRRSRPPPRWKRRPRVSGTTPPRGVGTPKAIRSRLSSGGCAFAAVEPVRLLVGARAAGRAGCAPR